MYKLRSPLDTGLWRVNGVSAVSRVGNNLRADFVFSSLSDTGLDFPFSKRSELGQAEVLKLPISHLFYLKIGSLWKDGKHISPNRSDNYLSVQFDASSQERIRLIDMPSVAERMECKRVNHHTELANSYAIKVPLLAPVFGCNFLVVPCAELVRFYFGLSQRLIRYVAKGKTEILIDWAKSCERDGVPQLHMLRDTTCLESCVFAEVLSSPFFKDAFYRVFKSFQVQSRDKRVNSIFINTTIPFSGAGNWEVKGIVTKLANHKALYVTELKKCFRDIGFSSYERHRDVVLKPIEKKSEGNNSDQRGGGFVQPPDTSGGDSDPPEDTNDRPDSRLYPATESVYSTSYENYYRVVKNNIDRVVNKGPRDVTVKPIEVIARSYEESDLGVPGTQQIVSSVSHLEISENSIQRFVDMLRSMEVSLTDCRLDSVSVFASPFAYSGIRVSQFENKIKGLRTWHKIKQGDSLRPRCFVAGVFVRASKAPFYLIELEKSQDLCYLYASRKDGAFASEEDLEVLMTLTAKNKNWPLTIKKQLKDNEFFVSNRKKLISEFNFKKIKHPSNVDELDEDVWAEQTIERIPI